jgi:hypothetical protein
MRVDFCDENDAVIGQAILDDDGTLRLEGCATKISGVFVVGEDGQEATPEDPEAYLRALPSAFRSPYLHASLVP